MTDIVQGFGYINGSELELAGATFHSVNPANGERFWVGNEASDQEIDASFDAANSAWAASSFAERCALAERFAELLDGSMGEELAQAICLDAGKTLWESRAEVSATKNKVAISIQAAKERASESERMLGSGISVTRFAPLGVLVVLGPYNFPAHLPNGHIVPGLLAGNTVVFKPSPFVPHVAEVYIKIWDAAGLPPGVLNMVHGGVGVAKKMLAHDAVSGVCFTGSRRGGIEIHKSLAGRPEIMLALEMGGNSPLIVWDYEDLDAAVLLTVQSAFITAGQRCSCARRLIVNEAIADEFLARLVAAAASLTIGFPDAEVQPYMGPLIHAGAVQDVLSAQSKLESNGGQVLLRAAVPDGFGEGAFVSPGIIDVSVVEELEDKEVFGPLLQVMVVSDFDEACSIANDSAFALAAGLVSTSREQFEIFSETVVAGVVNWNQQTTGASSAAPFGGLKQSGNHRAAGYMAVDYVCDPLAFIEKDTIEVPEVLPPGYPIL